MLYFIDLNNIIKFYFYEKLQLSQALLPCSQMYPHSHADGVTAKENNSIGSMGLNPNLNIEDEYIENLLKQIHFMSMEIKLIK